MRYNCGKEDMGGSFKCVFYGSIHLNAGSCTKTEDCEHKERHPVDVLREYNSLHRTKKEGDK